MNLTLIFALISGSVAGAAGFGLAWRLQSANILEIESNAKDTRIAAASVARAAIERATTQVITAQNHAALRAPVLRAAAAAVGDVGNGLRITTASVVRTATDDPYACVAIVGAYGTVVAESTELIQEMAASADQCFSDIQTLTEAFQNNP